jgi:hypothetical protein
LSREGASEVAAPSASDLEASLSREGASEVVVESTPIDQPTTSR